MKNQENKRRHLEGEVKFFTVFLKNFIKSRFNSEIFLGGK